MPDVDDIFGSDSSGDEGQAQEAVAEDGPADIGTLGDQAAPADEDLFGSDSDVGANEGPRESPTSPKAGVSGMMDAEVDPFADSDDDAGSRPIAVKTLGRLSKGGGTKEKRDKGGKGKKKKGDKLKKKKDKKRKRLSAGTDGENETRQGTGTIKEKKKKMKKAQELEDLGLLSSGDDEEVEADLEPEEKGTLDDEAEPETNEARTRDDDDFIDNTDDNPDLLEEYNHDAPPAGSDSEAEEDNRADIREDAPPQESAMDAVLKSMKRRKSQELSTAEREQIAQEFMYKINKASEDDEKAVKEGKPALNKLKMLKVMKATLAKKELQETFLEFDLLGVIARWLQPYKNGHLPNLTIRKEMLALVMNLPVQVDHLKRSGIGKIIMRLLNCREETRENKIVIRELVSKWNRPVYGQDASYRAMRSMQEEPEAIEVSSSGSTSNSARRRMGATWNARKRENPSRDEAVGNILSAAKAGAQASPGMRVPFSNGYAFSKAPKSRLESNGRQPVQQVDTSARSKLLKKMATLSRPVKKGV